MKTQEAKNIIVFGAGAVGASVAGWIAPHYDSLWVLDNTKVVENLKTNGLSLYQEGKKETPEKIKLKAITDFSEAPTPDIILIAVKNYSLDAVAKMIKDKFGDKPLIVALQNGVENQQILPKYFSKVIYTVIGYNAWVDAPGVVGFQKRGPLAIGALTKGLEKDLAEVAHLLNLGVETEVVPDIRSAAHSKMIVNLTNSLTTLIGHPFRAISDRSVFQKLLTNLTAEGVGIVKAAGFKEVKLGGMPPWALMTWGARLPQVLTRPMFEKNVKKMVMSSMAQDILQRGSTDSELESLNGYFISMADKYKLKAPYNRTVYELCREKFGKPDFKPLDVKEVWNKVQERL